MPRNKSTLNIVCKRLANLAEVASVPKQITLIINILFVAEILFLLYEMKIKNKQSFALYIYIYLYIMLYGGGNKSEKLLFLRRE